MRLNIEAAFPELASDPPTGWVAPWEASPQMRMSVLASAPNIADAYPAMRDAHLKEQGHEWPEDR